MRSAVLEVTDIKKYVREKEYARHIELARRSSLSTILWIFLDK